MQNKSNQKGAVRKHKMKDLSIVELIKANSILSQNCINLNNHINKCEMDINSLYHQNMFLKHELGDLKGVLEVFAMKMGMDKEMFEKQEGADISGPKKKAAKEQVEPMPLPLHDDLTTRCPTCKAVHNREFKTCNECGYKNK